MDLGQRGVNPATSPCGPANPGRTRMEKFPSQRWLLVVEPTGLEPVTPGCKAAASPARRLGRRSSVLSWTVLNVSTDCTVGGAGGASGTKD
jgi:hypothetical protein